MSKTYLVDGGPVSKHTMKTVNSYFHQHPTSSLKSAAAHLGNPHTNIQNIAKKLVHLIPYKTTRALRLRPQHYAQQIAFSKSHFGSLSSHSGFLHQIDLSGEFVFHVSGFAYIHNARIWSNENSREVRQHELLSEKITFWCVLHADDVVGSYYFKYFNDRRSEESIIFKFWTLKFSQKLHNSNTILFSRRRVSLLTL